MASPALRIRVRCPTVCPTPVQLEGCTSQTSYREFQTIICAALGLEDGHGDGAEGLSVLAGFPPRPLEMDNDAEIGSKLSDNESITVRLPTAAAGIQQGGKWGRSKRSKPNPPAAAAASAPTRASSRASKPPPSSAAAAAGATNAGGGDGGESGKKANGKGKKANERSKSTASTSGRATSRGGGGGTGRGTAAGSASSSSSSNGTAGGKAAGGVHTLGGPLTPPAASPRGGRAAAGGGSGSGQASARGNGSGSGSPPGQVRTLFGSSASTSSGRAGGSGGGGRAAAAAAAARRAGAAAAPGGSSQSPSPSSAAAVGGEPDAVAAAVAAAAPAGESGSGGGGPPNRKRPRVGTGVQLKSEGDIAERLLAAVGGGGKGTADRFFRKAMKLAVDKQYDQSRADARVRAALGGWYTAEPSATQRRLGDGESVALNISFSKGAGAKSQLTETVDRIPRAQVSAVVRMIARDPESREMLKPHNFAGCSPRMFWSLVQHWGGDVPAALRLAAPDVEWGFLDSRDRKPSEKAVANAAAAELERREAEREKKERERAKRKRERRKRRKEGIQTDSSDDDDDNEDEEPVEATPAAAPASPSDRGGVSEAARAADARRRAANAALARLTASQHRPAAAAASAGSAAAAAAAAEAAEAAASAPPEEAGREVAAGEEKKEEEKEEVEVDLEGLTEVAGEPGAKLLVAAGVRTLGQLADRDEEELSRDLAVLQQQQQQQKQQEEKGMAAESGGGGGSSSGSSAGEGRRVDAEQVSEWVQSARGEELDEIMADIVGEDEDVVEALEEVSVSTPRDLVRLGAFPDVLVGAVRDRLGAERFAPLAGRITAESVEVWRRKGDRLLEQRPWLELWVHGG